MGEAAWLIVHRAGRSRRRLRAALASPADYLEVDVWANGGRAESRHDPLLHSRLPFLTQSHWLPRLRLRRLWLEEVRAPGRLFLDLKDPRAEAVERTVAALRAGGSLEGARVSTHLWEQLDRLASLAPGVPRYYTVRRERSDPEALWRAYERRLAAGRGGDGVSIDHRLATPARLAQLRAAGLRTICFTVNGYERGRQLLAAGAGGLTSDRLDLIARWRAELGPGGGP